MEKKCRVCEQTKEIEKFYVVINNTDGYDHKCKVCRLIHNKYVRNNPVKKRIKDEVEPKVAFDSFNYRLSTVKKEDFYLMYEFLEKLGYDIKGDIHQQFIDRHNISTYKKRKPESINKWTYDELF